MRILFISHCIYETVVIAYKAPEDYKGLLIGFLYSRASYNEVTVTQRIQIHIPP